MIGKLWGRMDIVAQDHLILDVQGVGYVVFASPRTLSRLPGIGEQAMLLIDTHVREDHIHLYGFASAAEQTVFRQLTTVQGVGVRVALGILGVLEPQEIALAVAAQDKTALNRAPGVGPKLAQRIVTELKDRLGSVGGADTALPAPAVSLSVPTSNAMDDALSALVNLGYARTEAYAVLARLVAETPGAGTAVLLRAALKAFAQAAEP